MAKEKMKELTLVNRQGTPLEVDVVWTPELRDFLDKWNDANGDEDHDCVAVAYEVNDDGETDYE